jgi:AraC family transcriptional activator of pyochelin receptor
MSGQKHRIDVSPEMLSFIGSGAMPPACWPERPLLLRFDGDVPAVTVATGRSEYDDLTDSPLVLVVAGAAIERLFGAIDPAGTWHLPAAMRVLVLAICDGEADGAVGDTLRLARSIELLCMLFELLRRDELVPAEGDGALSERDTARVVAARRLIDERWHEKLTLDTIARACGLNRNKLTSGFRSLYSCTVADALTQRRLTGARSMLEATDLPVSTIGYRCGYLNNASFTRAFARHVGVAPTRWRAQRGLAA